jgi:hypothetical protein
VCVIISGRLISLLQILIERESCVHNYIISTRAALHRSLIQLVVSLGELHTTIRTPRTSAGSGSGSAPSAAPLEDVLGSLGVGMDGDKGERRAKIRELVDEVRSACHRI